jgi:outer membrane lipoprotein-sorting protein
MTAVFFCLFLSFPVFALNSPTEVITWLENLKTIQGPYQQQVVSQEGEILSQSAGTLILRVNPVRLTLNETSPVKLRVVFDGKKVTQYDEELQETSEYPLASVADAPLLALFQNPHWKSWTVSMKAKGKYCLIPPDPKASFQHIELQFEGNTLRALHIVGEETLSYSFL